MVQFRNFAVTDLPPQCPQTVDVGAQSTKRDQVLELLCTGDGGATIQEIAAATDWQSHSVRGFLAGVVRKKLGLNLISAKADRGRIYRIEDKSSAARIVKASKKRALSWLDREAEIHLIN